MNRSVCLTAIFEHATDGFLVTDHQGFIQMANPAFCALFGFRLDELSGTGMDRLMDDGKASANGPPGRIGDGLAAWFRKNGEFTGRKKDGSRFPLRLSLAKLTDNGQVYYTVSVHDQSYEKRNERSLAHEQHLNQVKSRMVSLASHEFRSPLSQINLSASLVERYYQRLDQEKIMGHLQKIKMAVNDMTDTLNDFLSLERIESGTFQPELKPLDLADFGEELCAQMQLLAGGHQLTCRHEGAATQICSDRNLLRHCLVNLLSNAVKYSPEAGRVQLVTRIDPKAYSITVSDEGIGIPLAEQQKLFEPFFRASNALAMQGTGLGLHIVQSYVRHLGGSIRVKSRENKGTTFSLSFPLLKLQTAIPERPVA